jgi:hypothetical protein
MSETNERSVASTGSVEGGSDIVDRLSDLSGDVGRWGGRTIGEAIDEIKRLRAAVRALLDGVNERYPDKNPRDWTCPHMAELDRLVPPEGSE